jgi:hypothetical protein
MNHLSFGFRSASVHPSTHMPMHTCAQVHARIGDSACPEIAFVQVSHFHHHAPDLKRGMDRLDGWTKPTGQHRPARHSLGQPSNEGAHPAVVMGGARAARGGAPASGAWPSRSGPPLEIQLWGKTTPKGAVFQTDFAPAISQKRTRCAPGDMT